MTLRLHSMQVVPRGSEGWGTKEQFFGRVTTLLFGANGAGKTPILRAMEFALGYPVELPPLLRTKCRSIKVTLRDGIQEYTVERVLFDGFDVRVTDSSGKFMEFQDEGSYSAWLLPLLGLSLRVFTDKRGETSKPYMSLIGPLFLVDQDTGWTQPYAPMETHNFLKDQHKEMVRWVTGLPPLNQPIDKKAFNAAKAEAESLLELITIKRLTIAALTREIGEDGNLQAAEWLEERKVFLQQQLTNLHSASNVISQATSAIDANLQSISSKKEGLQFKISNYQRRLEQISSARDELSTELTALEDNEVAANAFRSLCGSQNCQFFRNPEESYGKRLLYLKDQLKDFEFTSGSLADELGFFRAEFHTQDSAFQEAKVRKLNVLAGTEGEGIPDLIESMSRELSETCVRLDRVDRIRREKDQLHALLDKSERASDRVAELRPTSKGPRDKGHLLDVQHSLTETFQEWLQILRTKNLPGRIEFDEDLNLLLDGITFTSRSHYSGSTRTRLILAYHAALIETSIKQGGQHPGFLVLDAPKQHEFSPDDFKAYVHKFYNLSSSQNQPLQLVFSTSDLAFSNLQGIDQTWCPEFQLQNELRYLGPLPTLGGSAIQSPEPIGS